MIQLILSEAPCSYKAISQPRSGSIYVRESSLSVAAPPLRPCKPRGRGKQLCPSGCDTSVRGDSICEVRVSFRGIFVSHETFAASAMGYSLPALRTTIPFVLLCAAQLVATPAHAARLFLPVNPSALKNPMKGWRGQINKYYWGSTPILDTTGGGAIPDSQPIWDTGEEENLESIRKWYVHWDEIENPADDEAAALQRIKDYTDRHLGSMPARNMKALPRVEIYTKAGLRVPAGSPELREVTVDGVLKRGDRDHPWWETEAVLSRILRLVSRLGKVWDNDPRIAAVQVGSFLSHARQGRSILIVRICS